MNVIVGEENRQCLESESAGSDAPPVKIGKYSKRYFGFRLGAILLGLLPFLLLELVLNFVNWKQPDGVKDPYVGFAAVRPLFVKDNSGANFKIAEYRKPLFCDDSFLVEKPQDEFRIFCLGGSTVQGRPFAIETSFSTWLEQSLGVADDSKQWNVLNCGGVSYASYRLAPIMEEVLNYQPDLIVLYTGHNEFLEDRTYESIKSTSPWIVGAHNRLSSFKTYSLLRSLVVDRPKVQPATTLSEEVEARLDYKNGLEKYKRDDDWKAGVIEHFGHNLRRMLAAAKSANVPVILCNPVCNLRDASPFKSETGEGDRLKELEDWAFSKIELKQLEELVKRNPRHAGLQYQIGQSYLMAGDIEKARHHLVEAKEQDLCPLRIVEPMYQLIEELRVEFRPSFVDVKKRFEEQADGGIPGRELLLDHIHPSIHGHQLIAQLIVEEMQSQKMVTLPGNFEVIKAERYEKHLASLSHIYFQLGKDRLAGLKRWAEGKVTKEKN